ncbi:hypothetical protein EDB83DRAFT_2314455 [Lactarius deliciosus]|nr:hypothetical protein EDB83DRAFT_2314455 [Lactarius deliciosus]
MTVQCSWLHLTAARSLPTALPKIKTVQLGNCENHIREMVIPSRKQSKIVEGLGCVKRRKVLRRPPRDASCRVCVRGHCGRLLIEGLKPRASAARSGRETGSGGHEWSETVVHASARHETLHRWPPGLGMRRVRFPKAARECCTTRGNYSIIKIGPQ